ncbi:related to Lactobacillus putative histidine protein kinase SppK [Rhynchosporium secalis]|uniref:Related to Lactobacillus putative histidine protein kinase SppK n=1 Tax=Rhynchosporium secalis TaxID=38038 RepID=A0A1E1M303_RHYSE|nr:related to Lactobacillus putative histidine protein kinase SppK [Rhynchosporium secalis]
MGASSPDKRGTIPKTLEQWLKKRSEAIWTNLLTNHLWQRMFKNTLATTITVVLALIPAVIRVFGPAAYLGPITTVFGHPGRRFGMMAEALVMALSGTLLGLGWSLLGVYLSSLVYDSNAPAAYTIKGIFLVVALIFHGFLRSHTPRLFIFVLLLIIVSVVTLTGTATEVTAIRATVILYPILTAAGILLLVNLLVFPEFSSSFLGITTIETLGETVGVLRDAGNYFVGMASDAGQESKVDGPTEPATAAEEPSEGSRPDPPSFIQKLMPFIGNNKQASLISKVAGGPKIVKLKSLTDAKPKLRAKLAGCKAAQQECNFELAWAVLPPRDLKAISDTSMNKLVANTIALIGACESKYALMGDENDRETTFTEEDALKELEKAPGLESGESSRPGTGVDSSHDESEDQTQDTKGQKQKKKQKSRSKSKTRLQRKMDDLELIKPQKEISSGDIELLKHLVGRITKPLADLQITIDRSVDAVTSCLAYCYDVPKLPSGARAPTGIQLEEIDIRVDILTEAMSSFDNDSASALGTGASTRDVDKPQVDVMPRMETFLVSSFLLNTRQAALHTLSMLRHARFLVEKRQARHDRRRFYAPRINWRKWLRSGGEEEPLTLPETARKDFRTGKRENGDDDDDNGSITSKETLLNIRDVESAPDTKGPKPPNSHLHAKQAKERKVVQGTLFHRLRNRLADCLEYLAGSDDVMYAVKLTVAVFLVSWPAFVSEWNVWYSTNRGLWASLQLVMVTEVAIGTSVMTFMLRAVGTTIGCIWGYAAYEARHGNRIVCVIILIIGIIPSTYIQLGSKYVKAGMVCIISMAVVALATVDATVPGSATENFLKRLIAFLIGGIVALGVEMIIFPVRARDRLVESLAASVRQISEMEACLAYGIETETNIDVHSAEVSARFDRARGKAQGALTAAETFLPFCANEPRLKGSFKGVALVFAEILYVLHAVVDRMDNMLHLRHEYGSGVLEELNEKVYPYRRNVAGSITIVLFAVHEALTTKLPLPQFLPSARLAHLRMVNRVREVVLTGDDHLKSTERSEIEMRMVKRIVQQKFLSWNAASAGQIEVIEYLEELIDLVKLLVGANEFRSGMLTRPNYRDYVGRMHTDQFDGADGEELAVQGDDVAGHGDEEEERDIMPEPVEEVGAGVTRRRTTFSRNAEDKRQTELKKVRSEEELPMSLQRVRSRRIEELHLQRTRSRDEEAKRKKEKGVGVPKE